MAAASLSIAPLLNRINQYILNPLILLVFAVAFLIFFYGLFQFINSASDGKERSEGKKKIIWGLVGMFIMFSAYGIIRLIMGTIGLNSTPYIFN